MTMQMNKSLTFNISVYYGYDINWTIKQKSSNSLAGKNADWKFGQVSAEFRKGPKPICQVTRFWFSH